jgi:hypothetical protein
MILANDGIILSKVQPTVVNPPKKPIIIPALNSGEIWFFSEPITNTIPIKKAPNILIIKVSYGKEVLKNFLNIIPIK